MAAATEIRQYIDEVTRDGRQPKNCYLDEYYSPAYQYPKETVGSARIRARKLRVGMYPAYRVRGLDFVVTTKQFRLTCLEQRDPTITDREVWRTWMVDDPWHWWSIEDSAAKMTQGGSRFLVGGLGLGLIVHALVARSASEITVIERNQDVIDLIGPMLPQSDGCRIHLLNLDVNHVVGTLKPGRYDAAFMDLWVTSSRAETQRIYYTEAVPLAADISHGLGGKPVYTLGFCGSDPIMLGGPSYGTGGEHRRVRTLGEGLDRTE